MSFRGDSGYYRDQQMQRDVEMYRAQSQMQGLGQMQMSRASHLVTEPKQDKKLLLLLED